MTGADRDNRVLVALRHKKCARCKVTKPYNEFYMRDGGRYVTSMCIDCSKEYYEENKDHIREMRRKQRLGLPLGTYNYLLGVYGAKCGICGTTEPVGTGSNNKQFSIDHDHRTGLVRGLLCTNCNVGIGMLQHRASLLKSAIEYLSREGHSVEEISSLIPRADFSGMFDDCDE